VVFLRDGSVTDTTLRSSAETLLPGGVAAK
jgi:hypothetical protein